MQTLALELIGYQNNDPFPGKLTSLLNSIYKDINNNVYKNNKEIITKAPQIKSIEKLIKERFNMNVIFDKELHEYIPAAIIPFLSDYLTEATALKNISASTLGNLFGSTNIFKHIKSLDKEKEDYFKRIHNRKGFVDLKNARVGGYLADVKNYLIINFFILKKEGITTEELCAIILHELGHAFVGLETHHRLSTTNSTIAEVLNDINNNKVDKAYYTFKKKFDIKDIENASLGNNNEVVDFYGKIANTYLGELNSQLINNKYDETNYENLADGFASRFNVNRELVSGLNKIHLNYGSTLENNRMIYSTLFIIDLTLHLMLLALTGVIGVVLCSYLMLAIYGNRNNTMTYDFPIERYNRIKNSIINNLKNKHLPKVLVKDLLEQYYFIDEVINKSMYFKGVLPRIADFIIPENRNNQYYIALQQTIENNLSSVLFLKSAEVSIS